MKVVVIGGTGAFGSRLVTMLRQDGHDVVAAGRGPDADLRIDRAGELSALVGADCIVDAAGPFHAYGADPYRLLRFCIDHAMHYLDLSDNAAFCTGISMLDAKATAAGVFVLSGVSSVPALSSAAATALADGMGVIDTVETAILPGNNAPRGRAVVAAFCIRSVAIFRSCRTGKRPTRPGGATLRPMIWAKGCDRASAM